MHKTIKEGSDFVKSLKVPQDRIVKIAPPFTALHALKELTSIPLGGQNVSQHPFGAYTGEVSAVMLEEAGAEFVIIGHSERRQLFSETDEVINQKIHRVLEDTQLNIVLCIGECLKEREEGLFKEVLEHQLEAALNKVLDISRICIAYEPIWAIGTGVAATESQANEAQGFCKQFFNNKYQKAPKVLYGGSVKPENASKLLSQPHIDGFLVGGASLDVGSFESIICAEVV